MKLITGILIGFIIGFYTCDYAQQMQPENSTVITITPAFEIPIKHKTSRKYLTHSGYFKNGIGQWEKEK